MVKKLDELPEELISNISVRLHADDISALRLTCRALEHKSFHEFATEYFSEKCFMITTESLKVLVAIANSDKLKGHLHRVHFMTALFSERAFNCPNGCNCAWQPSVKQKDAYRTYIEDQKSLTKSGRDKAMLLEAFNNLTALTSLSIDDSPAALPPDVDYRGRNKVPRLTGRQPKVAPDSLKDKEYDAFVHHVWKTMIEALANSKMRTLTRLATLLSRNAYALSISPDLVLAARPAMKDAFTNLDRLMLTIRTDVRSSSSNAKGKVDERSRGAMTMKKLAGVLPALSMLDLTFDSGPLSGLFFTNFALNLDLKQLTKVYLQNLYINSGALSMIISKLVSIKDLRLVFINLTKGSWTTILKALQKLTNHLTHLHLIYLLEGSRKVYFLKQPEREDRPDFDDWYDGELDDDEDSEEDSEDDDSGDDTDDEMPALEPVDAPSTATAGTAGQSVDQSSGGGVVSESITANSAVSPSPAEQAGTPWQVNGLGSTTNQSAGQPIVDFQPDPYFDAYPHPDDASENHVAPTDPATGERGYYICLKNEQIAAQLPTFIAEYNLGDHVEDDLPPFPAGPGGFNNFLNMIGAAIGVPPPNGVGGHGPGGGNTVPVGGPNGTANIGAAGGPNPAPTNAGGQNGPGGGFATVTANGVVLGMGPLPPFLAGPGAWISAGPPSAVPPPSAGPTPATNGAQGGNATASTTPSSFNLADLALDSESEGWEDDEMD